MLCYAALRLTVGTHPTWPLIARHAVGKSKTTNQIMREMSWMVALCRIPLDCLLCHLGLESIPIPQSEILRGTTPPLSLILRFFRQPLDGPGTMLGDG